MSVIRVKSANLLRRDAAASWTAVNPVLRAGEEGYETDTGKRKVGDGTSAWNELPYTVDQAYDPTSENAQSGKAVAEAINNTAATKEYVDAKIGEINAALERILASQNL